VTATIRCESGAETVWVNAVAFDEAAQATLSRLHAGTPVTIMGSAKLGIYEKDGEHRPTLNIVCSQISALGAMGRQDGGRERDSPKPAPGEPALAFDDPIPHWGGKK
jgi:single-stranded DNA-binding protein